MPKSRDPFRGLNLSEQVLPAGRDQRLFAPSLRPQAQPPSPSAQEPRPAPSPAQEPEPADEQPSTTTARPTLETNNLENKVPIKQGSKVLRSHGAGEPVAAPNFNIAQRPDHPATFVFTDDELDALEDLKRDAKRKFGLPTTKQDLVRHAIHEMLEDYQEHGGQSRVIGRLQKK